VAFHELLIVIFITVTTPISLMVLIRAAVFRDEFEAKQRADEGRR
jgi:multicomponent K+:H+ antiporter subunit G